MINDDYNRVIPNEVESGDALPPPSFDEAANASAQPVEPIPARRFSVWLNRAKSAPQALNVRTKALAFVLVAGLALGTLGGMLLVRQTASPEAAPVLAEPTAEAAAAKNDRVETAIPTDERIALDAAADALQQADHASRRSRHRRFRSPASGAPRAYRVDVIR